MTVADVARIEFRPPKPVKQAFQRAVLKNETDMTAVLVALITNYAVTHGEAINAE